MKSSDIRQSFLDFFKANGHHIVASSSLIPGNDPTLLFTNAGMVQFKDVFLGVEKKAYVRATSSQKCVRAGGKHNDLENVGYTLRHHTFFEMLGNFSFGDYSKHEAIRFAWRFLTEVMQIPKEKLWITVFKKDKESEDIWLNDIGVDPKRFSRCGEKDNFWSMGETGPCGPCTEIFYDHGPSVAGGPPGSRDADGDRYVEIWNLVFMQYNRDISGTLTELPKQSVDTGMGLERISCVMQGVHDNYDTDLFVPLLQALTQFVPCDDFKNTSMRVIVDHIRSCSFLIADGVVPSNEGRGYVLRRIIRRAVRHGFKLGQNKPFFYRLVPALVELMGAAFPELIKSQKLIEQLLKQEEEQFAKTLATGLKILDQATQDLKTQEIPGDIIFQLYDTYGFPPDLTADIARERNLTMDDEGFERAMNRQREQSQQAQNFNMDMTQTLHIGTTTKFVGYEQLSAEAKVTALLHDNKPIKQLLADMNGVVVLDKTPFYAEGGGQVGDSGYLYFDAGSFRVEDTKKLGDAYLHIGKLMKGQLQPGDKLRAEVDQERRRNIMLNHSATHLLHEALRRVLGDHVRQKGSLVEAKRLRFDFAHTKALSSQEIQAIEQLVNEEIIANLSGKIRVMTPDEAKEQGALALFGERYGDEVRVLNFGEFSTEICGGTHVGHTGEIGFFKIVSEAAVASGVRRIEAVTGKSALAHVQQQEGQLRDLSLLLKTNTENIFVKLQQLLETQKQQEKELARFKQQMAGQQSGDLIQQVQKINNIDVLAVEIKDADRDSLREMVDQLKNQLKNPAVVLATVQDGKVVLIAGVGKNVISQFTAGDLLTHVASQVQGKGGGRPDLAQGGGDDPKNLPQALKSVEEFVKNRN